MYCPYGPRCQFKHKEIEAFTPTNASVPSKQVDSQVFSLIDSAKQELNTDSTKKRLSIFEKITFTKQPKKKSKKLQAKSAAVSKIQL
jgi:hypothetical protein